MENTEGPRRIRTAGKLVCLAGATVAVLYWVLFFGGASPGHSFAFLPLLVLPALIPGIIVWLIGWVIEGFGRPARPR